MTRSLKLYETLLERGAGRAGIWMSYGHLLSTVGRFEESIAAYRRAVHLQPDLGQAWWSLANLKTVRLGDDDIAEMSAALQRTSGDGERRLHLHFALGKALEDAGRYEESFSEYEEGNRIRQAMLGYDPAETTELVRRSKAVLTASFFAERAGSGCPDPDPIFIIGLPRAGSTLIEQILSSHSSIEGTSELPHIPAIRRRLGAEQAQRGGKPFPDLLGDLGADELRAIGEEYLESARLHRKTDKPLFVDKLPNNWAHIGLIHLILPNAKIIDARRHPLGCCFSNFKQHFAHGQGFTYSLDHVGRYYRDYVELLRHFDEVLPGRIHRVFHEQLVEDTRGRGQADARVSGPALRRLLPSLLRERPSRPDAQRGAGSPADQPRRGRALESVRTVARPAQGGARPGPRLLSASAGDRGGIAAAPAPFPTTGRRRPPPTNKAP